MSQYDVAKLVYNSKNGLTRGELINQIDLSEGAVEASIHDLLKKEYILKTEDGRYIWNSDMSKKKLDNLRPRNLNELDF